MAATNRREFALPPLRIEVEHGDGIAVLDPNEAAMLAAGGGTRILRPLPEGRNARSLLSGEPALLYRSSDIEVALTPDELAGLLGRELRPEEVAVLRQTFGDEFEWHDDFYDARTGEALQPMGTRAPVPFSP